MLSFIKGHGTCMPVYRNIMDSGAGLKLKTVKD